jgi:hypothetical protein
MDSEPILKKTLVTMAAMVSACVVFVGTLSIAAVLVTTHAVNPNGRAESDSTLVPADKVDHGAPASAKPGAPAPAKGAQRI